MNDEDQKYILLDNEEINMERIAENSVNIELKSIKSNNMKKVMYSYMKLHWKAILMVILIVILGVVFAIEVTSRQDKFEIENSTIVKSELKSENENEKVKNQILIPDHSCLKMLMESMESNKNSDNSSIFFINEIDLPSTSAPLVNKTIKEKMQNLDELRISDTPGKRYCSDMIENFEENTFDDLTNLESMEMIKLEIETLPSNILSKMIKLKYFNMLTNTITNLPEGLFTMNSKIEREWRLNKI